MWQWLIGIAVGVIATVITMKQIQHTNAPTSYSRNEPTMNNSHESRQRRNTTAEKKPRWNQDPNGKCGFCLTKMDITSVVYLECGHGVHKECAKKIEKCPTCGKCL